MMPASFRAGLIMLRVSSHISPRSALNELRRSVAASVARFRQRHAMTMLSDHILKDIGMAHGDVERGMTRPFGAPDHWAATAAREPSKRESEMKGISAAVAAIALTAACAAPLAAAQTDAVLDTGHAGDPDGSAGRSVARFDMRVSRLHAGASGIEVEQVLGRPTFVSHFDEAAGDNRVLIYQNEPIRTRVTVTRGRVSEVTLELASIDKSRVPQRARVVAPMMTRGGLLALLGTPDEIGSWADSGVQVEQLRFSESGDSAFNVFLVDGLVVDVKPGTERPVDIARIALPAALPDSSPGPDLRIAMTPSAAAAAVGSIQWTINSSFKGQPVLYATHAARDGRGLVSLTFTGGVLTAFRVWSSAHALGYGDVSSLGDE
jgi:uncharacterized protein YjiS (DUF1127 family)